MSKKIITAPGAVNIMSEKINAVVENLGDEYDSTQTYEINDICIHDNILYKCIADIDTPEAWTAAHWEATTVADAMKNAVGNVTVDIPVTIGTESWSSTSPYTYTWTNSAIVSKVGLDVEFAKGAEDIDIPYLEFEKVSGGIQFTAPEKPTGNIPIIIHVINAEAESVIPFDAFANVDIGLTITPASWSSTSPYTYSWSDTRITENCSVEVFFAEGADNCEVKLLDFTKTTGNITFTADVLPTQNLPLIIHVTNATATNVASTSADMISTEVITGASNVESALSLIKDNLLTMNVSPTYSDWFTPASGFTVSTGTIRMVMKNIYYVYFEITSSTNVFTDKSTVVVGSFKSEYFGGKYVTAGLPGYVSSSDGYNRPAFIQASTNGEVRVIPLTTVACNRFIANGLLIRREV